MKASCVCICIICLALGGFIGYQFGLGARNVELSEVKVGNKYLTASHKVVIKEYVGEKPEGYKKSHYISETPTKAPIIFSTMSQDASMVTDMWQVDNKAYLEITYSE